MISACVLRSDAEYVRIQDIEGRAGISVVLRRTLGRVGEICVSRENEGSMRVRCLSASDQEDISMGGEYITAGRSSILLRYHVYNVRSTCMTVCSMAMCDGSSIGAWTRPMRERMIFK